MADERSTFQSEGREILFSQDSYPFPEFSPSFFDDVVVFSLTVIVFSLALFYLYAQNAVTTRKKRGAEEEEGEYEWPSLARRNRVLAAVAEGIERYEGSRTPKL
ncbi:uncharacterized protein LOC122258304 isoform X2 [Penaeus japonicus]|uniref:uncharacterized protein LOC122258304 isoform X2 n=1 Tax=Penaeus japonicus TaxID=27405 RepID=UPI001C70F8CC|nr:uncharacterized protein LOC122258304 isoform X2 [Penaeus japonicus]